MIKRDVVKTALSGEKPPYVPWDFDFTIEAREKLQTHFAGQDLQEVLDNHMVHLGDGVGFFHDVGDDCVRDMFGSVWDRRVDKDIGIVKETALSGPSLDGYVWPDPLDPRFFANIPELTERYPDRFRVYQVGFSLYERAWTMRGMEGLLMDFHLNPAFVKTFLRMISDFNIAQLKHALKSDIDAVLFGDDWGQQNGLLMGPKVWHEFLYPELKRMFAAVKEEGRYVFVHSCGDVDELFDDLVDIGLDCFNPFQPEVMDVNGLMRQYRGKLSFYGGLSTQKVLPYGTPEEVRRETELLLKNGETGNYIFAPAHAVEGDVPLENILAFLETVKKQENHTPG